MATWQLRLLLVDDSEDDAELARRALARGGREVYLARVETRAELVDALESGRWDVVLCDQRMPLLGMVEAIEVVRSFDANLLLIVFSGSLAEDVAAQAMRAGANACLAKQDVSELRALVDRYLANAGA